MYFVGSPKNASFVDYYIICNINIKNIGIIHNREFADGVLKIELYSGEDADLSREVLRKNRYDVVERQ